MRELSLHILDIVTNSIEAQASRVIIHIEELGAQNVLRITVRDNGRGMTPEMIEKVVDPFVTSRSTRPVGMGLPLFKMAARQSQGDLRIVSAPGKGTTISADFKMNDINRSPLGRIAETVVNLAAGAVDTHLCYVHRTDSGRFVFDSYWIFARMAETESSLYDVLGPAKQYIEDKLKLVGSTV